MGNGTVALILDINKLIFQPELAASEFGRNLTGSHQTMPLNIYHHRLNLFIHWLTGRI
jgi:hypothetical protein